MKRTLAPVLLALALAFALAGPVAAANVHMPVTAAEHEAAAKAYREKAATLRQEARQHREMADAYDRKENKSAQWTGQDDAQAAKMLKSLRSLASLSDQMADEAEKAADYHTLRARELQGVKP